MAKTTLQLGFVPKNRGEYQSTPVTRYYKDNVVQYNGSSYIANPIGWSESDPTATYVTVPPTDANGNLNAGWKVFASGNNTFTTGEKVDNVGIDFEPTSGSDNLVKSKGVNKYLTTFKLKGKGNTGVYKSFYNAFKGRQYIIFISKLWDTSIVGPIVFEITYHTTNNQNHQLYKIYTGEDLTDTYRFTIPNTEENEVDYIEIFARIPQDVDVYFSLLQVDNEAVSYKTSIGTQSENLSNYINTGWYYFLTANLSKINDKPENLTIGCRMLVFGQADSNSSVTQILFPLDGSDLYTRYISNSVPTQWKSIKASININDLITKKSITWDKLQDNKTILHIDGTLTSTSLNASYVQLYGLKKGNVYRIYKPSDWTVTSRTGLDNEGKFIWRRVLNSEIIEQRYETFATFNLLPEYFDIIADDNDFYSFGIRADVGTTVDVVIEKIDISSNDINLSFGTALNDGYVIPSTGELYTYTPSSNANQSFKYMQPTLGKKYIDLTWTILLYSAKDLDRGLAWYDKDKNFISGIKWGDINVDENQRGSWNIRLKVPPKAEYFNTSYWGTTSVTNYPQLQKRWNIILTNKKEIQLPTLDGQFSSFVDFAEYDGPTGDTLMLQTYSDLISQWDAVQSTHSEVINQKTLLGYATAEGSGTVQPDPNLPIYEYVVHPIPHNDTGYEEYLTTEPNNTIKVLIVTGVHGAEKPASTSVLELIKHLVGHYSSTRYDEKFISIAQNCEFHIIPCVNPNGYNVPYTSTTRSARDNARGVNINRNFSHNWEYQSGGDVTAKGTEPYSELETQIVRDFIAANKDALVYIDAHTTYLGNSPLQGCYNYAFDWVSKNLLNSYMKIVSIKAQQKWPTIFTENQYIGFLGFNNQACTASEARYVNNIPRVATLEVNTNAGLLGRGNEEQMVLSLNQIVNYIRMCIDERLR